MFGLWRSVCSAHPVNSVLQAECRAGIAAWLSCRSSEAKGKRLGCFPEGPTLLWEESAAQQPSSIAAVPQKSPERCAQRGVNGTAGSVKGMKDCDLPLQVPPAATIPHPAGRNCFTRGRRGLTEPGAHGWDRHGAFGRCWALGSSAGAALQVLLCGGSGAAGRAASCNVCPGM